MSISERDKRRFKNIECRLPSDVVPGKCSCWYLNLLFLLGNEMQCTQKTLWFLSWEAELMPYGLMLTESTDNVIMCMCRIAVFIDYRTKTAENFWVLSSLMLNKKWNTINLSFLCSQWFWNHILRAVPIWWYFFFLSFFLNQKKPLSSIIKEVCDG